ncbi:hypothetical protein [Neisseria meningitidis]|uniref:hypothetical protein n=1 Tax=Neisseria meningitidis TaxID=487 RepID=UPI0012AAC6A2|nr:hypothetical protein [Neisseria meningitidis]
MKNQKNFDKMLEARQRFDLEYPQYFYLQTAFHHARQKIYNRLLLLVPHRRAVLFCACLKSIPYAKQAARKWGGFFVTFTQVARFGNTRQNQENDHECNAPNRRTKRNPAHL